jgi:hypothetical protein
MSDITINPLFGLVSVESRKKITRPKWMCYHKDAVLVDMKNFIYRCELCNPTLGTVTVIPRVNTKKSSPKKVTVSPTIKNIQSTENNSPTPGFPPD